MDTIIASIVTAVGTLCATFLSIKWKQNHDYKQKSKNILVEHSKRNQNVYKALKYLMDEVNSDRVYVYEFHNGEVYYSGGSQQKFSCTYEDVKDGISSEAHKSQNFRVSNFHYFVDKLLAEGGFCCTTLSEIEDVTFKHLLQDRGVQSFYAVPIQTLEGKIIGLLGVDFVKNPAKSCLDLDKLQSQARIICGYLA